MRQRAKSNLISLLASLLAIVPILSLCIGARAEHENIRHDHEEMITPTANPSPALKLAVLITGGIGTISAPTGETIAALDRAEIFDPSIRVFLPIHPMT